MKKSIVFYLAMPLVAVHFGVKAQVLTNESEHKDSQKQRQALAKYERTPDRARMEGRIYVDPNTGELVAHPVTEKQRALEAKMTKALQEDQSGLPVRIDADGMMSIELDERYWDFIQEQVSESGERHVVCSALGHDHNKHKANKTEHAQQAGDR
jgi:hypothetical protein